MFCLCVPSSGPAAGGHGQPQPQNTMFLEQQLAFVQRRQAQNNAVLQQHQAQQQRMMQQQVVMQQQAVMQQQVVMQQQRMVQQQRMMQQQRMIQQQRMMQQQGMLMQQQQPPNGSALASSMSPMNMMGAPAGMAVMQQASALQQQPMAARMQQGQFQQRTVQQGGSGFHPAAAIR